MKGDSSKRLWSRELRDLWKQRAIALKTSYFFPHMHYERAFSKFCAVTDTYTQGELLLLSGPTRVGKTTLLEDFVRAEVGLKRDEDLSLARKKSPHLVYAEVRFPHHKPYRPRLLYVDSLEFLGDGIAGHRFSVQDLSQRFRHIGTGATGSQVNDSQDVLRYQLERRFKAHGILYWLIDEAQDMFVGARAGTIDEMLSLIKSIANLSSTLPVMSGTYDLACAYDYNAQWNGRVTIVHFERYHPEVPDELQEWVNIVESFRVALGDAMDFNILDVIEDICIGAAGISGELTAWLKRSFRLALADRCDRVSKEQFLAAQHNDRQRKRLYREINSGEKQIRGLLEQQEQQKRRRRPSGSDGEPPTPRKHLNRRKSRRYPTGGLP